MIVSYHHNFIFIRTRKTASSTIETILKGCLGPDDLFVSKGGLRSKASKSHAALSLNEDVAGHMKAEEIQNIVPELFWRDSFKFTSERHPYEKAVSLAYYNFNKRQERIGESTTDFPEFLDLTVQRGSYRSFDHYAIDGRVVVQDFVRLETLGSDLARIAENLKLTLPAEFPQKRSGFRSDSRPAREILTSEQKRTVFERCREEFEVLGYEP